MKSAWVDSDAQALVARFNTDGIAADIALRVYTTRLLGRDPKLVLHGGGNTSVKSKARDIFGDEIDVLCVKGSGWDMGKIEPPGLPAVRLEPIKRLYELDALSDEDMVNVQRLNLLDSAAPNRIGFDLERVMKTLYRIDDFQQVYFVIDSIEQLKRETLKDFGPIYERLKGAEDIAIDTILPGDMVFTRGTQAYANKGGRFAA